MRFLLIIVFCFSVLVGCEVVDDGWECRNPKTLFCQGNMILQCSDEHTLVEYHECKDSEVCVPMHDSGGDKYAWCE